MTTRSDETTIEADDAVTRGTGNVFADLGFADAEERKRICASCTPSTASSRAVD